MVSALGSPRHDLTTRKEGVASGLVRPSFFSLASLFTSTKADGVLSAQFFYVGVASVYAR